jgi:hypothetical protein
MSSLHAGRADRPLQCGSTVQRHAAAHSQAWLAGDVTRLERWDDSTPRAPQDIISYS